MAESARPGSFTSHGLQLSITPEIRAVFADTVICLRASEDLASSKEALSRSDAEASTSGQAIQSKVGPISSTTDCGLYSELKTIESLALGSEPDAVPYKLLKQCCFFLRSRSHDPSAGPWVHLLVHNSKIVLPQPPTRKRSPELEARLEKLKEQMEWKEYNALVKDVDPTAGREHETPFMANFRHQAAFGLNVVTLMVTGYIVGQAAMAALYSKEKYLHPVGGVIGLIISMMVEVVLYVIIAERAEERRRKKMTEHAPTVSSQKESSEYEKSTSKAEFLAQSSGSRKGPRQRRKPKP